MKRKSLKILIVVLLGAGIVSAASVPGKWMSNGTLIEAFALGNGSSVTVSITGQPQGQKVLFAYQPLTGSPQLAYSDVLPFGRPPDKIIVRVCGQYVHAFINWFGDSGSEGQIHHYSWSIPASDQTTKDTYTVLMPLICGG